MRDRDSKVIKYKISGDLLSSISWFLGAWDRSDLQLVDDEMKFGDYLTSSDHFTVTQLLVKVKDWELCFQLFFTMN